MPLTKPFKRTLRPFTDRTYHGRSADWMYLLHPDFAENPRHYVRAFELIVADFDELLNYVEPCDQNLDAVSLKVHELLVRTCIEIEANFTAILRENNYRNGKWDMKHDYCLIDYSHRLSEYEVMIPFWTGDKNLRRPFGEWANKTEKDWHSLPWYQIYNKSKHYRHEHFDKATFSILIDAICGLVVVLSSQFKDETFSTSEKVLSLGTNLSYQHHPDWKKAIGSIFKIRYPESWNEEELYDFNWKDLNSTDSPVAEFDYNLLRWQSAQ